MTTRRFQVGQATLSAHDPHLTPALANAHRRRVRPLCLCREPAASMYIARVAGQFIPKRMPGTGAHHDPGCESYEAPPELSGFGEVVGRAIQEDADAGVITLRLGFSLSRTGRMPLSSRSGQRCITSGKKSGSIAGRRAWPANAIGSSFANTFCWPLRTKL